MYTACLHSRMRDNPVDVFRYSGINSWIRGTSTHGAGLLMREGYDTNKLLADTQWTTRISLKIVNTKLIVIIHYAMILKRTLHCPLLVLES